MFKDQHDLLFNVISKADHVLTDLANYLSLPTNFLLKQILIQQSN